MSARTTKDAMTARRFPPPWDIEEANAACFIVKTTTATRWPMSTSRRSRADVRRPSC